MKKLSIILLLILACIYTALPQTTRYWIGGGTAYGNDGTKWSLTSGGSAIGGIITWQNNDIAKFDANSGTGIVVIINAIGVIGKLQISGNRTVTIRPDDVDDRVLDINTATTDAFTLEAGSTFIITGLDAATDRNLKLNMNSGTTANIYGYLKVTESETGYGEFTKSSGGVINFNNGSTYEHNTEETGSDIPVATWNTGSTCKITGFTTSLPGNYYQNFYHFTWDCASQGEDIDFNGNLTTINGNFTVANTNNYILGLSNTAVANTTIKGNYIQSGGKFALSLGSIDNTMNIDGSFSLAGGYFYMSIADGAHATVNLKGNMSLESGAYFYTASGTNAYTNFRFTGSGTQTYTNGGVILYYKTHFTVVSPAILDLGSYVLGHYQYSTGNFTLESGAGLKTTNANGITSTGNASGCIQLMGTRYFSLGSHYTFYAGGAQSTGNGLPSTISGSLTIGSGSNNTNLSFTNSTAINGSLVIINGTAATSNISYGSAAILEYRGTSIQTMGNNEWPSSTVPNLKINNAAGVTMNNGKTISSNLNLYIGTLNIGENNTLTLNNSSISVNSGTITGSSLSNIIFSGSGNTTLPGIINGLNNLTINRSGSTITIGGAITVNGTMTMTTGACTSGGGSITYGASGTLKYNGTASAQTTGSAEFPTSGGPVNLIVDKSSQTLNLHASRQINNYVYLDNGILNLGANTLTIAGNFATTVGSIISSTNGQLVFSNNIQQGQMPSSTGVSILTIIREAGVNMTGSLTVNDNLYLTKGALNIGIYELTLNGAVSIDEGTLTGGTSASLVVGGSGASTSLPGIELRSLSLNRANGISFLGDVTIHEILTLTNGQLSMGANTLYINGGISSTDNGSLGGAESNVQVNETSFKEALNFPNAELNNLYVTRSAGTTTVGNVIVHKELNLSDGSFLIGNYKTLTLNGLLIDDHSNLTSTQFSNLAVGGTGDAFEIPLSQLNDLTLGRPDGVILGQSLTIYGNLTLVLGTIDPGANALIYSPNASLRYLGPTTQTTTSVEWPTTSGPGNVIAQNFQSVKLHESRTIERGLSLVTGAFEIQSNTLTLNGNLLAGTGSLLGGTESNLILGGEAMALPLNLPGITLNNLTLSRASGLNLAGMLDLYGILNITGGLLNVGNQILTLRNPITGKNQNLSVNTTSILNISGDVAGMNIGPSENLQISQLGSLWVQNTNPAGISIRGNLQINTELSIGANSKLTIDPNAQVDVQGHLNNLAGANGLVLRSFPGSADASLIHTNPNVPATVERYVETTEWTAGDEGWHLISSPVESQEITGIWTPDGASGDYDLFAWDEISGFWLNQKVSEHNITHFLQGKGYFAAYENEDTKNFSGDINVDPIPVSNLTHTVENQYAGWNLVGNPYTSALNWAYPGWIKQNISPNAKVWSESTGSYKDVTADYNNIIPPMNGFMVYVEESQVGFLMIPPSARIHNSLNWLKSIPEGFIILTASETNGTHSQECIIRTVPESTEEFESVWDSKFMAGFAPRFYSIAGNNNLSLNSLPTIDDRSVIHLGFIKNKAADFCIRLETPTPGFVEKIFLTDRKTATVTELSSGQKYDFTASEGDDPHRFLLHFKPLDPGNPDYPMVNIYSQSGNLYLDGVLPGVDFRLINISGQEVLKGLTGNINPFYINAGKLPAGFYIVNLAGGNYTLTRKVFLK